jgi:hypothetical protein
MNDYDKHLYFTTMGGKGKIQCLECNFQQEIVSYLHGVNWNNTGFQCQKCGKFHEINLDMDNSKKKKCDCGGKLDRDKHLFCPECKTFHLAYCMSKIT